MAAVRSVAMASWAPATTPATDGERGAEAEAGEMREARDGQWADGDGDGGDASGETEEARIRAIGLDGIALRGRHVREMRAAVGLSVRELAGRLNYSWQAVYAWETEARAIPREMYVPIVEALHAARVEHDTRMKRVRQAHLTLVPRKRQEGRDA